MTRKRPGYPVSFKIYDIKSKEAKPVEAIESPEQPIPFNEERPEIESTPEVAIEPPIQAPEPIQEVKVEKPITKPSGDAELEELIQKYRYMVPTHKPKTLGSLFG